MEAHRKKHGRNGVTSASARDLDLTPQLVPADAVNLTQSVRRRLNNVKHLLAEGAQKPPGVGRADASDHSG